MKKLIQIFVLFNIILTPLIGNATQIHTSTKQVGSKVVISPKPGYTMYIKVTPDNLEGLEVIGNYNMATSSSVTVKAIKRGTWKFGVTHGDGTAYANVWHVVDVVDIDIPQNITLKVGDAYTYKPVITDSKAETTLRWHSSNESVVSISNSGYLKAKQVGNAIITVTASNGVKATSSVSVEPIKVQSITCDKSTIDMHMGESRQINYKVSPSNATDKSVRFYTSNPAVADVSTNGEIVALSLGYSFITITSNDGSNVSTTIKVIVAEEESNNCKVAINVSNYGFANLSIPKGETLSFDYTPYSDIWKVRVIKCNGSNLEPSKEGNP